MKQSIGYVAVVVKDYDEAIRFYVDTLGFSLVEDTWIESQQKRWVLVAPPGSKETKVLLARASDPEQIVAVFRDLYGNLWDLLQLKNAP